MSNNCESEKRGLVVKVKNSVTHVKVNRAVECNGCKACMLANVKKEIVLPASNNVSAKVGDNVIIALPKQRPAHTWLVLFALPLVTLLLGMLVGYVLNLSDLFVALCVVVGLILGLLAVFVLDRTYFSNKYLAKIVAIVDKNQGE